MIKYVQNDKKGKTMNVQKIISIFQSFYINVSVEKIALTLPISFEKRFTKK